MSTKTAKYTDLIVSLRAASETWTLSAAVRHDLDARAAAEFVRGVATALAVEPYRWTVAGALEAVNAAEDALLSQERRVGSVGALGHAALKVAERIDAVQRYLVS